MAKLLTRQEIETMHDTLRRNFDSSSNGEIYLRMITAKATTALALLEADKRLRELDEEDSGKIARLPLPTPGKTS